MKISKSALITALALFIFIFGIYIHTLNPVFHADDSPETAACAKTLGIQHPPGYPLPALIGKIFTMIPAANTGFRVNIQAAFFGAAACALTFLSVFIMLGGPVRQAQGFSKGPSAEGKKEAGVNYTVFIPAVVAGLLLAFGPTLWSQSLSSKGGIYALNIFLLSLLVFNVFIWEKTGRFKYLYLFSLIAGVSAGNHWESMAVAAPAFIFLLITGFMRNGFYRSITAAKVFKAAGFFILGMFIYLYLVIRAKGGALLNWGDPVNLKQLLWVFFREEYTGMEKARELGTIFKQSKRAIMLILREFTAVGVVFFILGFFAFKRISKAKYGFFAVLFITLVSVLCLYFNLKDEMMWIMDVFLIPAYFAMACLAAAGFYNLLVLIKQERVKIAAAAFVPVLPVFMLVSNYRMCDQSQYYYAYDYGRNVSNSVTSPGIALLEGDFNVMPQMYFKHVEKSVYFCPVTTIFMYVPWGTKNILNECPDIKITYSEKENFSSKINNLVASNYMEREIFTSVFRKAFTEFYPQGESHLYPNGLVMKFTGDPFSALNVSELVLKQLAVRGLFENKQYVDSSTRICLSNYSSALMETGNAFSKLGRDSKAEHYLKRAVIFANSRTKAQSHTHLGIHYSKVGRYEEAISEYEKAIKINPKMQEAYSNMAGIYNNLKKYDEAIKAGEKAVQIKPDFGEAYNNLAIAHYYKGDKDKAIELLEKAVNLSPENAMAKKNLEILKGVKK